MNQVSNPFQRVQELCLKLESRIGTTMGMHRREALDWFASESCISPLELVDVLTGGRLKPNEYAKSHEAFKNIAINDKTSMLSNSGHVLERQTVNRVYTKDKRDEIFKLQRLYLLSKQQMLETCRSAWGEFRELFITHDAELPIAETSLVALDNAIEKNISKQVKLLQVIAMFRLQQQARTEMMVPTEYQKVLKRMSAGESYSSIRKDPNSALSDSQQAVLELSFATKSLTTVEKKRLCNMLQLPLSRINQWSKS